MQREGRGVEGSGCLSTMLIYISQEQGNISVKKGSISVNNTTTYQLRKEAYQSRTGQHISEEKATHILVRRGCISV